MNPNRIYRSTRLLLLLFIFCSSYSLNAFQQPLKLSELYLQLIDSKDSVLEISNRRLIDDLNMYDKTDAGAFFSYLSYLTGKEIPTDSIWLSTSVKELSLVNVNGSSMGLKQLRLETISLRTSDFRTLNIDAVNADILSLDSVRVISEYYLSNSIVGLYEEFENRIDKAYWEDNTFTDFVQMGNAYIDSEFYIQGNTFKDGGYVGVTMSNGFSDFDISENTFEPMNSDLPLYNPDSTQSHVFKAQFHVVHYTPITQWVMENNIFQPGTEEEMVHLEGEVGTLSMTENDFGTTLVMNISIGKHWGFRDNTFRKKIDITDVVLAAKNNELTWDELAGFKMAATVHMSDIANNAPDYRDTTGLWSAHFKQGTELYYDVYYGETDKELEDEKSFQELISSYYRIYKIFKENGQVKDANRAYVEMKDVELRELSFKWKNEGGFENWINWRLNRLLRFYTDYGTNPSKAISISVFVVLIFSVFYFFFPSEWDTKSKGQLLQDYRIFVDKNDKGYARPFINLSLGFGKSLLNAMTLSLNSFVTLGFGSIPTTGLARYVCILQGFLGWFLLSIFTASLINQVMF